ncbi:MAG: hypothetical protein ABSE49_03755 [Polyangiaceae bacterium]|jgi:hypothetical protein
MNAPLDPVNKAPKRAMGGRHKPPAAHLTGRSGVAAILGIDRREVRRLEEQGILRPAVVQANGVRWFDIDTVWKLAIERQKAGKKPQRRARPKSDESEGIERVTGAETRQITAWFAAGLSHAEVVLQSGKTHETIRYLYAQYITPSGARLRRTGRSPTLDPEEYFPEHEPSAGAARPWRAGPLPRLPAMAQPQRTASTAAPPPTPRPSSSAKAPAAVRRPLTQVPDSWFTNPLPPASDDDCE